MVSYCMGLWNTTVLYFLGVCGMETYFFWGGERIYLARFRRRKEGG